MEEKKEILSKIWGNLIFATILMLLFIGINILFEKIDLQTMNIALKSIAIIIMTISITIFEIAYKKDKGMIAITAIEMLVIAIYTLSIMHIVTMFSFEFRTYILMSSYLFSIYFVLKSIIIYTNEKRKYLKSLSDIKDIVTNEPTKKEAQKKKNSSYEKSIKRVK